MVMVAMEMCVDERARWVKGSTRKFVTDILFYKKHSNTTEVREQWTRVRPKKPKKTKEEAL